MILKLQFSPSILFWLFFIILYLKVTIKIMDLKFNLTLKYYSISIITKTLLEFNKRIWMSTMS